MARFADALDSNPAPRALGDVALRYEPSMLIGETARGQAGWRSYTAWGVGVLSVLGAVALIGAGATLEFASPLIILAAIGLGAAVWLERFEKRRRRFVANFATTSLRLDFQTPIAGQPRTLVVPFDSVKAVELFPQADGAECLCVDFVRDGAVLREVLVAYVPEAQRSDADRLTRVLRGAFGLGDIPPDSPLFGGPVDPTSDDSTSSFQ